MVLAFNEVTIEIVGIGFSSSARASLSFFLFFYLLTLIQKDNLPVSLVFSVIFISTNVLSDTLSFVLVPAFSNLLGIDYAGLIRPISLAVGIIVLACLAFFSSSLALGNTNNGKALPIDADFYPKSYENMNVVMKKYKISKREYEVMLCIIMGNNYKATAHQLGVSVGTVQSHIKRLYAKFGVHSRQELKDAISSQLL
jgi:DNA-binding CsgD family transcriptional regulator